MSVFFNQYYKIHVDNKNFIEGIKRYNPQCIVTSPTKSDGQLYHGSEIWQIMQNLPKDTKEFMLELRSANSISALNSLPRLFNNEDPNYYPKKEVGLDYIDVTSSLTLSGKEIGYGKPDLSNHSAQQIKEIAIKMLDSGGLTSMLHFEKFKMFLVQNKHDFFILTYDDKPEVRDVHLTFDLDDGFKVQDPWGGTPPREIVQNKAIIDSLSPFYVKWKENNYQGELIPKDCQEFNFSEMRSKLEINQKTACVPSLALAKQAEEQKGDYHNETSLSPQEAQLIPIKEKATKTLALSTSSFFALPTQSAAEEENSSLQTNLTP